MKLACIALAATALTMLAAASPAQARNPHPPATARRGTPSQVTLSANYALCGSKSTLQGLLAASAARDRKAASVLIESGSCLVTKGGEKVTVTRRESAFTILRYRNTEWWTDRKSTHT
ncbi:MAG: hypothetical protein K2Q10_04480, partial [Rhodospirillales bacterium]|nr:hypothetical protein [Rhodospirillales bacterium]